jgi:hypothetical protein
VPNLGRRFKHGCLENAAILDRLSPEGWERVSTCITRLYFKYVNIIARYNSGSRAALMARVVPAAISNTPTLIAQRTALHSMPAKHCFLAASG